MENLLAIDVGNSTIQCAFFENGKLKKSFYSKTRETRNFKFIPKALEIEKVIVSSVVPKVDNLIKRHFKVPSIYISHKNIPWLKVKTRNPKEVGADRLVAAWGAWQTFKADCLVIDLGTATTLDVVLKNGEYRGGLICPGFELSRDILFERTAKLPKAPLNEPPSIIGNTTVTAIQAGLIHGYRSMLEGLIAKIKKQYGHSFKIIAIGGHAPFLAGKLNLKVDLIDAQFLLKSLEKISRVL